MDDLVARLRAAGCVFAAEEAAVLLDAATSPEELEAMTVRRIGGEPLEQIVGWASFAGLRVRLLPGVFVPRRRSELMVRLAVERLRPENGPIGRHEAADTRIDAPGPADRSVLRVVDLGCGSGAIGAAVAAKVPDAEVWAVDIDPDAVTCARLNLPPHRVLFGDLYAPLPGRLRADVICANAPYVPIREIALLPGEARDHEHRVALDGGDDGLAVQRRVVAGAGAHLTDAGVLLIETSRNQADSTRRLAEASGMKATIHTDDTVDGTVVEFRR